MTELDKLSKKQILGYSFGAIPAALLLYVFNLFYVDFFYNDLKLLPVYFIVGQVIYGIINGLNDPLLGQLSDRTNRQKWGGRRIPYIKYGAPIWAIAFIITWIPWSMDNQILIFLHFIISICLFDTMLTLVVLCWMALLPEMTSDIQERNIVNFYVLIIGLIGVLPFVFLAPIFKEAGLQSFQVFNVIVAIISVICFWIVSRVSKEKVEFQEDEVFPLWKSIKETLKLKSFKFFILFNFFEAFISSIGLTYLFAYAFILGGDIITITALYFLFTLLIGYSSNFLCIKLQPRWGMRKTVLRFGLIKAIIQIIFFLLILNFSMGYIVWLGIILTMSFGGYGVFNSNFLYLCMDEDEVIHGTRREGMFLGTNALIVKPAQSLGPIIATLIFGLFGFIQNASTQTSTAILGIKILFFLIPAMATLIGLIFMYFYPLYGKRLNILKKELKSLHKYKREEVIKEKRNFE